MKKNPCPGVFGMPPSHAVRLGLMGGMGEGGITPKRTSGGFSRMDCVHPGEGVLFYSVLVFCYSPVL